jgi:hypothetical protein
MSNVRFTVDPDGLDALSARLGELVSALAGLDTAVGLYDPSDLGSDRKVARAAADFAAYWASNLTRVGTNVAGLQDRLRSASGAYRETETRIRQSATPPGTA